MRYPDTVDLEIEPLRALPPSWGRAAFWSAWEALRAGMSANLRSKAGRRVLAYAEMQAQCHWAEWDELIDERAAKGRLRYFFSDEQGNADVASQAVPHWISLVLGLRRDKIAAAVRRNLHRLVTPAPDVQALVDAPVAAPIVVIDQHVCQLCAAPERARGWRLRTDINARFRAEDLSSKTLARLDALFKAERCACELCQKVREKRAR